MENIVATSNNSNLVSLYIVLQVLKAFSLVHYTIVKPSIPIAISSIQPSITYIVFPILFSTSLSYSNKIFAPQSLEAEIYIPPYLLNIV